jgi:AraC-like DNA-binding protein
MQIVLSLGGDKLRHYGAEGKKAEHFDLSVISGPYSEPFVIDTAEQRSLAGIHFKPGGAFPFFGIPLSELHNLHVTLDELWGREIERIGEMLVTARSIGEQFLVLERFLLSKLGHARFSHPAVGVAVRKFEAGEDIPWVSDLSNELGMSQRHFIKIFKEQVGLTPKLFCRLRRFNGALERLKRGESRWDRILFDFHYFDQAHFIHEFKEFSGLTPTMYLKSGAEHLHHVPLSPTS